MRHCAADGQRQAGLIEPPLFRAVASMSSLPTAFAMVIAAALAIAFLATIRLRAPDLPDLKPERAD
jgi:hypothetical protein